MLVKSLTYEQRKKNTIFVRYFLVAKPEKKKINQKKSMFSSFSLEEWSSYSRWKAKLSGSHVMNKMSIYQFKRLAVQLLYSATTITWIVQEVKEPWKTNYLSFPGESG